MANSEVNTGTVTTERRTISRRSLLGRSAAFGAVALASPMIVRQAGASSGELNILAWSSNLPKPVMDAFTAETGIKVNMTPFSQNEEQINKLQATMGEGFDICTPSFNRAEEYRFIEVLAPLDTSRIDLSRFLPRLLKTSTDNWTWDGELYHLPQTWGTEGLAFRNDLTQISYADASYGLIWDEKYKGQVQVRPISALLSLGIWLDATGKLPSNRMLDAFKDEETMHKIYDEILAYALPRKDQVKQFWDSADGIKSGFVENGCALGLVWDGPPQALAKEGKPISYIAPQEGALAWVDGLAITRAARNVDQIYAFLDYITRPEAAGRISGESNYNPVVAGAEEFVPEENRKAFLEAYPENAIDNLWFYPPSPAWYISARNEYAERFKVA